MPGDVENEFDVGVVVVIGSSGHHDVVVCQFDVLRIRLQVFRGGHHYEPDIHTQTSLLR